ncbi:MAG: patatin family protein [Eubacteriales bacterium]|nr:patatin family protein [Eubacteriales bacterium]
MKTGLIMEGGAMRGLYTAGVTDVMMENGVTFDGAAGVSAGAAFGCNYKSRQIGRVIRYNKRFAHEKRFCSLYSLITTGDLYGADFCYRLLPDSLDPFDTRTYEQNPMEFYVVCTDMDTGKAVYHRCDTGNSEDIAWMRASASMPIVSKPVEIDGMKLLDGGISDSIPVRFFESIGYERNVIILTQPLGYRKQKMKILPLLRTLYPHNREMVDDLAVRHEVYNETIDYIAALEHKGKAFVIRPSAPLNIGSTSHDITQMERVYQEGRRVGRYHLAAMKRFIEKAEVE